MTPEKESLLTAKIDLLIELAREQQGTLRDQGKRIDSLSDRFDSVGDRFDSVGDRIDLLNRRIDSMGDRIGSIAEDVAFIKAHMAHMPQPAEFHELRGRVEEISRRLPTAIAYAPPAGREKSAE